MLGGVNQVHENPFRNNEQAHTACHALLMQLRHCMKIKVLGRLSILRWLFLLQTCNQHDSAKPRSACICLLNGKWARTACHALLMQLCHRINIEVLVRSIRPSIPRWLFLLQTYNQHDSAQPPCMNVSMLRSYDFASAQLATIQSHLGLLACMILLIPHQQLNLTHAPTVSRHNLHAAKIGWESKTKPSAFSPCNARDEYASSRLEEGLGIHHLLHATSYFHGFHEA